MLEVQQVINSFLNHSFDGVLILSPSGIIIEHNSLVLKIFSLKEENLEGNHFLEVLPFLTDFEKEFEKLWKGASLILKNKSYRESKFHPRVLFEINGTPLINEEGNVEAGLVILRDVTELKSKDKSLTKKRLKDALKAFDFTNDRLKYIINSTSDLIAAIDSHYRFILYNNSFKDYFEQYTGKSINLGVSILDCVRHIPEQYEKLKANWDRVFEGNEFNFIDKIVLDHNHSVFLEISYNIVKDRDGNILGASNIIRDITERMKTEDLWIASEKRFSKVFNEAGVGFLLIDLEDNRNIQANLAFCEMTGYHLSEIQNLLLKEFTYSTDYTKEKELIRKLLSGDISRYQFEKRIICKDKSEVWVSETVTLLYDVNNEPEFILAILENINERKLAQQKLLESEAQKTALVNAFPDMIFQLDRQGNVKDYHLKNHELKGIPYDIIGRNFKDFTFPKKIKDRVMTLIERALEKGEVEFYETEVPINNQTKYYEARFVKSGVNEVVIILRDITERKEEEAKIHDLLEKQRWFNHNLEIQNEKLALQEKELAITNEQLVLQNENLSRTTQALRNSREKLKETLRILEDRNFELDQFVYKTSHDLRSPLSSILGILNLINLEKDPTRFLEYAQMIEGRVLRLDDFILSMLDYSRNNRSEIKTEKINYQAIISECLEDLKYYKNFDSLTIHWDIEEFSMDFYTDILRLKIIISNIISNAIKYQDYDKTERYIRITIKNQEEFSQLIFEDNGIGIAPDYLQYIFKMFYRATESSEGSGLGLYIVKQTVDKLRGNIQIHSEGEKKGLRVWVEIPNRRKIVSVSEKV